MRSALFALVNVVWAGAAQAGIEDKLPLDAYRNPIDRQIAETGKGIPGRPFACVYSETRNGHEAMEIQPTDLCVKMLPQQHWRGLWRNNMEGSTFCPEPARECPAKTGESIWLESGPGRGGRGDLYRVDFIGRKTMYKGPYGHMSMYDEVVVMDRAIKIELIERAQGWPPDPK